MRRQNKRVLYESIMRDVAKVVKRRLNESDEEINEPKKITKLSKIPFDYLLNPELNEDFVRRYPTFFKLNDNGKIGMCVYKLSDFSDIRAKYHYSYFDKFKSRFDYISPILTFYICITIYFIHNVYNSYISLYGEEFPNLKCPLPLTFWNNLST